MLPIESVAMPAGSSNWPGPPPFTPQAPIYSRGGPADGPDSARAENCERPKAEARQSEARRRAPSEVRLSIHINLSQLHASRALNHRTWGAVINGAYEARVGRPPGPGGRWSGASGKRVPRERRR